MLALVQDVVPEGGNLCCAGCELLAAVVALAGGPLLDAVLGTSVSEVLPDTVTGPATLFAGLAVLLAHILHIILIRSPIFQSIHQTPLALPRETADLWWLELLWAGNSDLCVPSGGKTQYVCIL